MEKKINWKKGKKEKKCRQKKRHCYERSVVRGLIAKGREKIPTVSANEKKGFRTQLFLGLHS